MPMTFIGIAELREALGPEAEQIAQPAPQKL